MKLENKSNYTINFTRKALNTISKHANLDEPEEVRMFIAMHKASDGYKRNLCIAYNKYCKFYNIAWNMPKYEKKQKTSHYQLEKKYKCSLQTQGSFSH